MSMADVSETWSNIKEKTVDFSENAYDKIKDASKSVANTVSKGSQQLSEKIKDAWNKHF